MTRKFSRFSLTEDSEPILRHLFEDASVLGNSDFTPVPPPLPPREKLQELHVGRESTQYDRVPDKKDPASVSSREKYCVKMEQL